MNATQRIVLIKRQTPQFHYKVTIDHKPRLKRIKTRFKRILKKRENLKMLKYRNRKITVDNITFASYAECGRYRYLKLIERLGEIKNLTLQPKFDFTLPNVKKKLFTYIADFAYTDKNNNQIIEDVKGFKTPLYRLKKKLIEAQHNIKITEIIRGQ